jgi:hypothetical protein
MLKARAGDVLIFGLTAENLERLKKGRPIAADLRDIGIPNQRVMIFYAESVESMMTELRKAGVILMDPPKPGESQN